MSNKMKTLFRLLSLLSLIGLTDVSVAESRVKVALIGMAHGHVNGWLRADYQDDVELVGIYETNVVVTAKYRDRYGLDESLFFRDLDTMLDERKPEAAWVFTSTYDHEMAVEACAKRGIHVIVEKPLAVNLESAERMAKLAREHEIHLLTNLETTWYPSLQRTMELVDEGETLGEVTKIVSHFGHIGPVEIRCQPEFLDWLTDPVLNGGGASADFGCYGANIITHIMNNKRPLSVTAVYQTHKPDVYPKVDDDATIILEYPGMQGIIQASWDWPYSRKDVHVYGRSGVIRTINQTAYDIRLDRRKPLIVKEAEPKSAAAIDSVKYYAAVIRGEIDPSESLSSLKTNLIAVEIIDAARESARSGKTIEMKH
jgi:predicted dehydrogenase